MLIRCSIRLEKAQVTVQLCTVEQSCAHKVYENHAGFCVNGAERRCDMANYIAGCFQYRKAYRASPKRVSGGRHALAWGKVLEVEGQRRGCLAESGLHHLHQGYPLPIFRLPKRKCSSMISTVCSRIACAQRTSFSPYTLADFLNSRAIRRE